MLGRPFYGFDYVFSSPRVEVKNLYKMCKYMDETNATVTLNFATRFFFSYHRYKLKKERRKKVKQFQHSVTVDKNKRREKENMKSWK